MKMSEFEVGKRYRNPDMLDCEYVSIEDTGGRSPDFIKHLGTNAWPAGASYCDITRDDWEEVQENPLTQNCINCKTQIDYSYSFSASHRGPMVGPFCKLCNDIIVGITQATATDPRDEAWEKASSGHAFPCLSMKEWARAIDEAKEWFRRGYSAAMEAK